MCKQCDAKPVYTDISGKKLCARHFIRFYEKKILRTIRAYEMIKTKPKKDKVLIVVREGNKNDFALLHFFHRYCQQRKINIIALFIQYSQRKDYKYIRDYCVKKKIDFAVSQSPKSIFEEKIIKKFALKLKTIIARGECLNDAAVSILNYFFNGEKEIIHPIEKKKIKIIRPLYFCKEEENKIYCLLNKIKIPEISEIPKKEGGNKEITKKFLRDFEKTNKGILYAIINKYEKLSL